MSFCLFFSGLVIVRDFLNFASLEELSLILLNLLQLLLLLLIVGCPKLLELLSSWWVLLLVLSLVLLKVAVDLYNEREISQKVHLASNA